MPSSSASPDPVSPEGLTYYELLQSPPTATLQELRQSFRQLSKCYHPDTTTLPAPVAELAFQQLQRAYAVLSDPQARQLYDERLRLIRTPAAASATPPAAGMARGAPRPVSLRRALSGGEWFALLLLGVALVLSLVLGLGVAWARGAEMVRWPSWWAELHPAAMAQDGEPSGTEAHVPSP
ncbi:MAG: J domain-containing protein [Cyanobacteriota bacterium]|nr:J domain-containing protein [Cyanobacteriota bacterium]